MPIAMESRCFALALVDSLPPTSVSFDLVCVRARGVSNLLITETFYSKS